MTNEAFDWIEYLKKRMKDRIYPDSSLEGFYKFVGYVLDRVIESEDIVIEIAETPAFKYYNVEQDIQSHELKLVSHLSQVKVNSFENFKIEFDDYMIRLLNNNAKDQQALHLLLGQERIKKIVLFIHYYDPNKDEVRYFISTNARVLTSDNIENL